MLLGEYELNDMLEGQFEDPLTLYFTMGLLVFLAIIGRCTELIISITMRNIIHIVTFMYRHTIELQYILSYKFQFGHGEPCCCYHSF